MFERAIEIVGGALAAKYPSPLSEHMVRRYIRFNEALCDKTN